MTAFELGPSLRRAQSFRGTTLEEILPRIREELGAEAVITRRREGIVGGIGGFFGKKCIEVEAEVPTSPTALAQRGAAPAVVPARTAVAAYSAPSAPLEADDELFEADDELFEPDFDAADLADPGDEAAEELPGGLLAETLLRQSRPFADELEAAQERFAATVPTLPDPPPADVAVREELAARRALAEAGFSIEAAERLVRHALTHLRPFAPTEPLDNLVRRALAGSFAVKSGWRGKRRVVCLVGVAGSQAESAAAALCRCYAETGLAVGALGLGDARSAVRLAAATEDADVRLVLAEEPDEVARAVSRLEAAELVVACAPEIDPADPDSIERAAALIEALAPSETQLVLPATLTAADAAHVHAAVSRRIRLARLLPTRLDEANAPGGVLSLASGSRLALTWLGEGTGASLRLRPADAAVLAWWCLP